MTGSHRLRRLAPLGVAAVLALALAACARDYPNTTFTPHSDLGRAIDFLWNRLFFFGMLVFVLVELALIVVVIRYRRRSDDVLPPQTHGNVPLEITWTLIPAAILAFIAVPTVKTIFETQAPAPANALTVEVWGHQWWWEFRYPQYNVVTANEIYLPKGRPVDLVLRTRDVIHSFWVPQLAGKRDAVSNHTNHIVFTPDANMPTTVWNGFCAEYCGVQHGEMHFRVVTVDPAQFASWVARESGPAVFNAGPAPAAPATGNPTPAAAVVRPTAEKAGTPASPVPAPNAVANATATTQTPSAAAVAGFTLPRAQVPDYTIPHTPIPAGLAFDDRLTGDATRGQALFTGAGTCNACHTVRGNPLAAGVVGPDLTHVGSRIGIAGMMYVNDAPHLARWIKNARVMKQGTIMPTLGKGQYDPDLKATNSAGLTDQQIADVVAYLQALK